MALPPSTFGRRDEGLIGAMHALLELQPIEHTALFVRKPQGQTTIVAWLSVSLNSAY